MDVSGQARQRSSRSVGVVGAHSIVRRILVISMASAMFLVAFICDTGAIAGLFWACLAGHVGQLARLAAFGGMLLLLCVLALAFCRPARLRPAKIRQSASGRPARSDEQNQRNRARQWCW
jgi:hypothetical protein